MQTFKLVIDAAQIVVGFDDKAKNAFPGIELNTEVSTYLSQEICREIQEAIAAQKDKNVIHISSNEVITIQSFYITNRDCYVIEYQKELHSPSTENYLKAIVQSQVHAQILLDTNGQLLWFNKKATEIIYQITLKTPETGVSISNYALSRNPDQFDFHLSMAQSGALTSFDERFEIHGSSEMWLKEEFLPVIDSAGILQGVAFNLYDITASKKAVNQLLQTEDRYKLLLNNLQVGVIIHRNGQIIYCNNAAAKIAGAITAQELIGAQLMNHITESSKKKVIERIKSIQKVGDFVPKESEKLIRLNRQEFEAEVSATGVLFNGDFAIQVMINDISSFKKSENEYLNYNRQLMLINKELEHFSYIVSHNLRTPIANSQALFNYLDLSQLDESNLEIAEKLGQSIQKANSTLDDLLNIIQYKKQQPSFVQKVQFTQLIKEFQKSHFKAISDTKTQIIQDFEAAENIIIDRIKIESIFQNLLTNAVKYRSPDRDPIIKVTTKQVGNFIHISFEDNGLGMDLSKIKDSIFGLFKTFHNNEDAKGLGLFLVKSEVEALNGNISVSSEPNKGTIFTLELPIIQLDKA